MDGIGMRLPGDPVPSCPLCDGPCRHEFERSQWRFPDRLPKAADGSADPIPEKPVKVNPRGRRAHRPTEDRMHRPSEDRMHRPSEDRA